MKTITRLTPLLLLFAGACNDVTDDDGHHGHSHDDNEVITKVVLNFAPQGGGDAITVTADDPENDGDPVIENIVLQDASDYDLTIEFINSVEDPEEDITAEIDDEAEEHQVFFTGSGVQSPATGTNGSAVVEQAYADQDAGGLPVGLANTITTMGAGNGDLTLTLRHMPDENGEAVKTAGAADTVASEGFGGIGGDNDIQLTFPVEVQ